MLVLLLTSPSELVIQPCERVKVGAVQLRELLHYQRQTGQVSSPQVPLTKEPRLQFEECALFWRIFIKDITGIDSRTGDPHYDHQRHLQLHSFI